MTISISIRTVFAAILAASVLPAQSAPSDPVSSQAKAEARDRATAERLEARLAEVVALLEQDDLSAEQRASAKRKLLDISWKLKAALVSKSGTPRSALVAGEAIPPVALGEPLAVLPGLPLLTVEGGRVISESPATAPEPQDPQKAAVEERASGQRPRRNRGPRSLFGRSNGEPAAVPAEPVAPASPVDPAEPADAEPDLAISETVEVALEGARAGMEAVRTRAFAERVRAHAEAARDQAEAAREQAEAAREQAEVAREHARAFAAAPSADPFRAAAGRWTRVAPGAPFEVVPGTSLDGPARYPGRAVRSEQVDDDAAASIRSLLVEMRDELRAIRELMQQLKSEPQPVRSRASGTRKAVGSLPGGGFSTTPMPTLPSVGMTTVEGMPAQQISEGVFYVPEMDGATSLPGQSGKLWLVAPSRKDEAVTVPPRGGR